MTMTTNKEDVRQRILEAVRKREEAEQVLLELCPPCKKCCPGGKPRWPCSPGEVIVGPSELGMCKRCWGRGYILETDEDDDDAE